jgi:N-acetylglucosamine kinase-like BadF-type ATPase
MPEPKQFVLGLDGGGSKTIAFVCDDTGHVIGTARAGGSEIYGGGETAIAIISDVVQTALGEANLSAKDMAGATFSLAGVDWPEDATFMHDHLAPLFACDIMVRNDAVGALDGAVPIGPAIVVACGTGCATASRGNDGVTWHSGFWQYPLGSHELGLKALQAICLAHNGISEPTSLLDAALHALQLPDVEALLHGITRRGAEHRLSLSCLTPLLLDAAQAGDPVSHDIVLTHGTGLGQIAAVAARHVGISGQAISVALTGGVFRHASQLLPNAILDALRGAEPRIETVLPFAEPIVGSVIDALRRIGVNTNDVVLNNLRQTAPPADFFDTHISASTSASID